VAKYRYLPGNPIRTAILTNTLMQEFIEFGLFDFFDNILVHFFPEYYDGLPVGSLETTIVNFATAFKEKIKAGEEANDASAENANKNNQYLKDDENTVVNSKFDKCIKDNTPDEKYTGTNTLKLLKYKLNQTSANIKCGIQKSQDVIQLKQAK
jgi:hypothetical protein